MPKYAILRDLPDTFVRADIDGLALEGVVMIDLYNRFCGSRGHLPADTAALHADPAASGAELLGRAIDGNNPAEWEVRWIRSYWAPGTSWAVCLYEAASVDDLRTFQTTCQADEGVGVREVLEVANPKRTDGAGGTAGVPPGWELVALDLPTGETPPERTEVSTAVVAAGRRPPLDGCTGAEWVRAYWPDWVEGRGGGLRLGAVCRAQRDCRADAQERERSPRRRGHAGGVWLGWGRAAWGRCGQATSGSALPSTRCARSGQASAGLRTPHALTLLRQAPFDSLRSLRTGFDCAQESLRTGFGWAQDTSPPNPPLHLMVGMGCVGA